MSGLFLMRYKNNLIPLSVKASLLVPGREFIVSRREKLVPKMELGDSDNTSLVATSGTCSISGCLAAEIPRPPCSTKSWRLTLSDVFEVQTLFEPSTPLKKAYGTLRNETKRNETVFCEMVLCEMVLCETVLCETVTTQCFITPYLEYLEFH